MSKLEELIQKYCPDGVEWKTLNSITEQFSGMTGVSNKWAESGNCQFIDYNNVYKHLSVDVTALKYATVKSLNQNALKQGDILFTSASETPDECALAAVIEDEINEGIFLDDHLFGLRLLKEFENAINPSYLKYAFHSEQFRALVRRVVRGVTRNYVSKTDFMKLEIPIPPLPVQEEIVRVLDTFTELQAELQAGLQSELQKRKQQFSLIREEILTKSLKGEGVKEYTIQELILSLKTGLNPRKNFKLNEPGTSCPYITGKDIYSNRVNVSERTDTISSDVVALINKRAKLESGLLLFASTGTGTVGRMAIIEEYHNDWNISETLYAIKPNWSLVSTRFLMYSLYGDYAVSQFSPKISKGSVPHLKVVDLLGVKIKVPSLEEQEKVVTLLDGFEALANDLLAALPAEIEKRRQQYEYYRDKLLTFNRKEA